MGSGQIVPAIMYHNIRCSQAGSPPVMTHMGLDQASFRAHLDEISRMGYQTITLDDLWAWKRGDADLPPRAIVLSFDDGYLDNWLLAHPELEKRGMQATIFVNPEFVRPDDTPPEGCLGYLSWAELQAMIDSGVWRVESHTLTHNFSFISSRIVDYHRPGTDYYWLYWMDRPDRKPFWLVDNWDVQVPFGRPVFEFGRTLAAPMYQEDTQVRHAAETYVRDHGGAAFFEQGDWRTPLDQVAQETLAHAPGCMETPDALEERVRFELGESKRLLESHLTQQVNHVCWPGGGFQPKWGDIALEAGYRSFTLPSLARKYNIRTDPPHHVKRFSFSRDLGLGGLLPAHMGHRLAVRAKLSAIEQRGLWGAIHSFARRLRDLKR